MSNDTIPIITIDVDWVPDFIISEIADILIRNHAKATWFITHDSEATRKLSDYPKLFEVGLHPNFMENSTQGTTPKEVMTYLKKIVPDAVSVRTHALVQSTILLRMLASEFGIRNDVSLLLPRAPYIIPHRMYLSENSYLVRLPYFWQDDVEALHPTPSYSLEDKFHHIPGLKIYDFHPIHIVLNTHTLINYKNLKSNTDIPMCKSSDITKFKNKLCGSGTFFEELIRHMSGGYTIEDVAGTWNKDAEQLI